MAKTNNQSNSNNIESAIPRFEIGVSDNNSTSSSKTEPVAKIINQLPEPVEIKTETPEPAKTIVEPSATVDTPPELPTVNSPSPAPSQPSTHKSQPRHLPDERQAITHKFEIAGHEGYLTVGLYDNGQPGELFIRMAKTGTTVGGLLDALSLTISVALQYGVPISVIIRKLSHTRFEPSGLTRNPNIRSTKSITDYIARWLANKFLSEDQRSVAGLSQNQQPIGNEQLTLDIVPEQLEL